MKKSKSEEKNTKVRDMKPKKDAKGGDTKVRSSGDRPTESVSLSYGSVIVDYKTQ